MQKNKVFILCLSLCLSFSLLLRMGGGALLATASFSSSPPLVIIDAGHGGRDGGAVGTRGTLEKDLNLSVARELFARFQEAGIPVMMTRNDDDLVLKEGEDIAGHRKEKDLYNRAALAKEHPDAIFVSIHMNAYPVGKYRGLQVYYNQNSAESTLLARRITERVKKDLDPVYTREAKAAKDNIYLLSNIESCAVLVECGFLSNSDEEGKLLEKDYQKKLSFCIFYAIIEG